MTILIVLVGLLISHFATGFRHLRRFHWVGPFLIWLQNRLSGHPWAVVVGLIVATAAISWLALWFATALLGFVGAFLLALIVFILTIGPRDLDRDVAIISGQVQADGDEQHAAYRSMRLTAESQAPEAAAAVLHAGLSRWFGLLFWFVLLGVPGALIYRLTRVALQVEQVDPSVLEWLARLRLVLDWPVLALLSLSLALVSDLDRVFSALRSQHENIPIWVMTPSLLDRLADTLVNESSDFQDGLALGHQAIWRILVLWLVVLSILLLAGWLA